MKKIVLALSVLVLSGCGVTEQLGHNCGGDLKELCYNVFGGRTDNQQDSTLDHHQTEIDGLQRQIDTLQSQMTYLQSQMGVVSDGIQSQIDDLSAALTALELHMDSQDAGLQSQIDDLSSQTATQLTTLSTNMQGQIDGLNSSVTSLTNLLNSSQATQDASIAALSSQLTYAVSTISTLQGQISTLQSQSNSALVQLAVLNNYVNIVDVYDPCGAQGSWNEVFLHTSDGRYIASFSDNANGQNTRFTVLQDGSYVTTDGTHCYFTVSGGGTVISGEHN